MFRSNRDQTQTRSSKTPCQRYRPAVEELESRLVLSPPGTGWQLSFEDTFQGTALDTRLWRVDTSPRRDAQNTANAISVNNGSLTISTYTSGAIHYTGFIDTRNAFHAAFGYWEARIKFHDTAGEWSAFWVHSPTMGNPIGDPATAGAEIDVMEHRRVDGSGADVSNKAQNTLHWDGYGTFHQSVGQLSNNPTSTSLQENFHTYGLLWTPDRYVYFIDGIQVWTTAQAVSHRSQYLLLTSEVQNNSWAGSIPSGGYGSLGTTTTKMTVSWVRAWEKLPAGWSEGDIGAPGRGGGAYFDTASGAWTVSGGGADIWGTSDQFHFASENSNGDGRIVARVSALTNSDPWAKAGIMFRDNTGANAPFADVVATPGNGVGFQWRSTPGGQPSSVNLAGLTTPVWLQLVRSGNDFSADYSSDGVNWIQIGTTQTIAMNSSARAGLAVTAHNNGTLNTATFDHVSALPASWSDSDIGAPIRPGGAYLDAASGAWTVYGGGADIWGTSDQFHFAYASLIGDGQVYARAEDVANTDAWAKAGVMLRDSTAANAAFAAVELTPGNGVAFQWRPGAGASALNVNVTGIIGPVWLDLDRSDNQFTAYYSTDAVNWFQIGTTQTVTMASTALAGLAVTSHNNTAVSAGAFDNVTLNLYGSATQVDLSSSFNRLGIVSDGAAFSDGLDGNGFAYSANLLGASVSAGGFAFALGTADTNNVVQAQGQTIALPAGPFSTLTFLATAVNGNQVDQTFIVTYTDGTSETFSQSLSDWYNAQNYAGETTAASMSYTDRSDGTQASGPAYLRQYSFRLDCSNTVAGITLPVNSNVMILALDLVG
jgi:beta-glucanase (GH16 family)